MSGDEFWSFVQKNCLASEITKGDCWIGIAQGKDNGLIIAYRVGKHTDSFIEDLIINTKIKTECENWFTDGKDSAKK